MGHTRWGFLLGGDGILGLRGRWRGEGGFSLDRTLGKVHQVRFGGEANTTYTHTHPTHIYTHSHHFHSPGPATGGCGTVFSQWTPPTSSPPAQTLQPGCGTCHLGRPSARTLATTRRRCAAHSTTRPLMAGTWRRRRAVLCGALRRAVLCGAVLVVRCSAAWCGGVGALLCHLVC